MMMEPPTANLHQEFSVIALLIFDKLLIPFWFGLLKDIRLKGENDYILKHWHITLSL